ncbi:MAG: transcriptional regulator, LuxR family, partial [Acidimicrobiales bacterium]|nr:transcriptional regulator, LuxR family [Acidimicrobiales bacterium]
MTLRPALPPENRGPLRGRAAALATLDALLERAAAGAGGGATVVGEPGIGKSALLDELADRADGWRVIRVTGLEAEVELAWSGLFTLLSGLTGDLDRLPAPRAAALREALALDGATGGPIEGFAVAVGARDLLAEAAEEAPVLVLVDDLPWVDLATRRTLAFVARRVRQDRIAVVSARRVGAADDTDTGPLVALGPLEPAVADGVLRDEAVTSAEVRRRLTTASGGIPLVLVEAARLLSADQRAGTAALPDPLPVGPSGQRIVDVLVARLDEPVRRALVVAAAEPEGRLGRILAALARLDLSMADLEAAERGGLVALEGDQLRFRHPLMRSAAYHDASRPDRRAAHRALAESIAGADPARAWHRARAAAGPDETIAA